jgi:3-phenylpropionate/cinnamic acid dioxygenase small subunit
MLHGRRNLRHNSADRVVVRSYVTVLATAGDVIEVVSAGANTDVVARGEDGWRIAAKTLHLDKDI